jgi:hypothetical protein
MIKAKSLEPSLRRDDEQIQTSRVARLEPQAESGL